MEKLSKEEILQKIKTSKANIRLITEIRNRMAKDASANQVLDNSAYLRKKTQDRAGKAQTLFKVCKYKMEEPLKEFFAVFDIDYTYKEERFKDFIERVKNDKNEIDYNTLSAKDKKKVIEYASWRNTHKEALFKEHAECKLINTDKVYDNNYEKLIQKRFDYAFKRKANQQIDLDKYSFRKQYAPLYHLLYDYVAHLNDLDFRERVKNGEHEINISPQITIASFINTNLKGYKTTRYSRNTGEPITLSEREIQENLAIKYFAKKMNERSRELGNKDEKKIMGKISPSQYGTTVNNASRYAVRKGLNNQEYYSQIGFSGKGRMTKSIKGLRMKNINLAEPEHEK